ncbi:hypothetical protein PABG_12113 [Paracoccidioides brasiliensis Pb03]|nr:hypothetical protein PABG_12113 [Paracoccidioides brasiliensis Pb03]
MHASLTFWITMALNFTVSKGLTCPRIYSGWTLKSKGKPKLYIRSKPCVHYAEHLSIEQTHGYTAFDLLLLARNLLIDGEATYLARIVELEGTWADLPGVVTSEGKDCQYPFYFSDEEKAEIERDVNGSSLGMQAMQSISDSLGDLFPEQGVVRPEQYEEAKDALCQAKEFIIREFARNQNEEKAWEEEWPFSS